MQVKAEVVQVRTTLSADDCARYMREGRCFGCGKTGHRCPECPDGKLQAHVAAIEPAVSDSTSNPTKPKKLVRPTEAVTPADVKTWNVVSKACQIESQNTVVVSVITPYQLARLLTALITLVDSIKTTAMVDSGAMGNFIHPRFVKEHKLVTKNRTPLIVNDVNGRLLLHVDQQVEIRMMVGNHAETLTFDVAPLGKHNIVLGLPWLQQHNPTIHWTSGKVTFASNYCEEHCLAQPASTFLNQCPIVS